MSTERILTAGTFGSMVEQIADYLLAAGLSYGHGVTNPEDEALWLAMHVMGLGLDDELPWQEKVATTDHQRIQLLLNARIDTKNPLAYLINETWFAGEKYYVDERVLVPRSFIVEWIEQRFSPWIVADDVTNILDLCTGSGCLGIALAKEFADAEVTLSDISAGALSVAKRNVDAHGLQARVSLNRGDLFAGIDKKFDLIVSNPPYVADSRMARLPAEYLCEPDLALRAGADGLSIIIPLLAQVRHYLTDQGAVIIESGSASEALEHKYPDIPFNWLATESDEKAIFLMSASELDQYQASLVEAK